MSAAPTSISRRKEFPFFLLAPLWVLGVGLVCVHHWLPPTLTHGVLRGAYGAELLFGLVGFAVTWLAVRAREEAGPNGAQGASLVWGVYARVAARSLPVYMAFLVVIFFTSRAPSDVHLALWTGTYNLHAAMRGELTGTLAHMWAPSIAFWFCVLWIPCAAHLAPRALWPTAACLIALGIGTRMVLAASGSAPVVLRCAGVTSLDALGTGALASVLILRHGAERVAASRWTKALLVTGAAWIVWGMSLQFDRHGGERALWESFVITTKVPFYFAVLVLGARERRGVFARVLEHRLVRLVAEATLAIYLAHAFTPLLLRKVSAMPILPFGFFVLALTTVLLGVAVHLLLERRFLRLAGFPRSPAQTSGEDTEHEEREAA